MSGVGLVGYESSAHQREGCVLRANGCMRCSKKAAQVGSRWVRMATRREESEGEGSSESVFVGRVMRKIVEVRTIRGKFYYGEFLALDGSWLSGNVVKS